MICLEELDARRGVLDCKHAFCMSCLVKWTCTSNLCPVCRSPSEWITKMYRSFPTGDRVPLVAPQYSKPAEDPNPLQTYLNTTLSDDTETSDSDDDPDEIPAAVLRSVFDYVEELGRKSRLSEAAKQTIIMTTLTWLRWLTPSDLNEAISGARSFIRQEVHRAASSDPR
jgi:hypothetical protein